MAVVEASTIKKLYENLSPLVSVKDNFDALRIPEDHPSRRLSDTYYVSDDWVVRTHMTAHLSRLAKENSAYLVCGPVARKDDIDSTHYPVFTQVDGYCETENPEEDLRSELVRIITSLYPGREYRFADDYFPFTINSIEVEVRFGDRWVEILGGGTVHPDIMKSLGKENVKAYAFGIGLDRLAMIQYGIEDIRILWSEDDRFLKQFEDRFAKGLQFESYSNYPACIKDISFFTSDFVDGRFAKEKDLLELVRELSGDIVESVSLIDSFDHPKKGLSNCFRISYRSNDRSLTNEEINKIQDLVREEAVKRFNIELR